MAWVANNDTKAKGGPRGLSPRVGRCPLRTLAIAAKPDAAARELCGYLKKLYGIQTRPGEDVLTDAGVVFLVGSPKTNPNVAKALGSEAWPEVSDQGLVLKRRKETKAAVAA